MLKRISINNFKSWRHLDDLQLGRVTLLFGENSSGKTSLIQTMLLLKQTVESFDRAQPINLGSRESLVELGMYEDFIYGHDTNLILGLSFEWKAAPRVNEIEQQSMLDELDYSIDMDFKLISGTIRVKKVKISADGKSAELQRSVRGGYKLTVDEKEVTELGATRYLTPVKGYGFPPEATQKFPQLNDLSLAVEDLAANLYYLGPLRVSPQREYVWSGSAPAGVGGRGETTVQAILANVIERMSIRDKAQREKIPELVSSAQMWLRKFGLADSFELKQIRGTRQYQVKLLVPGINFDANVADVGVGVSQVLPVVILGHFVPEGSTVILEQPEIHLHPSVQARLADMFFELASKRNIQFIVETHSEHLLTRMQRRVAESQTGELTEKDVILHIAKRQNNQSVIEPLRLDSTGRIENWPKGFFGDTVADREAIMQAYINKRFKEKNG